MSAAFTEVCLFLGPTLSATVAEAELPGLRILPPAKLASVYQAVRDHRPRAIGLVDGFFETVPAVWHSELLYALSEGVHVYGASSMGALRAAELHTLGMRGVGKIFADYRDGVLTDDDAVAVVHGPAAGGYEKHNEALVNLRATLQGAVAAAIVTDAEADALEEMARSAYYPTRSLAALTESGLPGAAALGAWVADRGVIDQKALDARELLTVIGAERHLWSTPFVADFVFPRTSGWAMVEQTTVPE